MVKELVYLQGLKAKWGAHYIRKYFGFTLTQIAERIKVSKSMFSYIVDGKKLLPKDKIEPFVAVFYELDIYARTQGFVESQIQAERRMAWMKIKDLTTPR